MEELDDDFVDNDRETDLHMLRQPFDVTYMNRHLDGLDAPAIIAWPETSSTQDEAKAILRQPGGAYHLGAGPLAAVLVADKQDAGRGRMGRAWNAPSAAGLLATYVVRRTFSLDVAFWVTAALGMAVRDEIEAWLAGANVTAQCRLKWPNDVLLNGRKLAGILTEAVEDSDGQGWLLLGCGLNVSLTSDELDEAGVAESATSLWPVLNTSPRIEHCADDDACVANAHAQRSLLTYKLREKLLLGIIGRFQARLMILAEPQGVEIVRREWRDSLATLGQRVQVTAGFGPSSHSYLADALSVADDGTLCVRRVDTGEVLSIQAGDVSLRRPDGSYGI